MVIKQITMEPISLSPDEVEADEASTTFEDYDDWVRQAIWDLIRKPPRFHTHPDDPATIECPTARIYRIGYESINMGKPSTVYQELMEVTNGGRDLPFVSERSRKTAQRYLDISRAFVEFMRGPTCPRNFKEAKEKFRIGVEQEKIKIGDIQPSQATIDDALEAHGLNWKAYDIESPRKKPPRRNT
jgi:hypothetical protein